MDKKLARKKQKKSKNDEVFYDSSTNDADLGLGSPNTNNDDITPNDLTIQQSNNDNNPNNTNNSSSNATISNQNKNPNNNNNARLPNLKNYVPPEEDEDEDEEEEEFLFFNKKTTISGSQKKKKSNPSSANSTKSSGTKKKRLIITSNNIINPALSGISGILNPFKGMSAVMDKKHDDSHQHHGKTGEHGAYQASASSGLFQLDTKFDSNYYNYYDYYIKELRWKKIWSWLCCCSFTCNVLTFSIIAFLAVTLSFLRDPFFYIDQNQIAQLPVGMDLKMNTIVKGSNSNIFPILIDSMSLVSTFMDPNSPFQVEINLGKVNFTKLAPSGPQINPVLSPFGEMETYGLESATRPEDIPNLQILLNLLVKQTYSVDIKVYIEYKVLFFLVKSTTIRKTQTQRLY